MTNTGTYHSRVPALHQCLYRSTNCPLFLSACMVCMCSQDCDKTTFKSPTDGSIPFDLEQLPKMTFYSVSAFVNTEMCGFSGTREKQNRSKKQIKAL